MRYQNYQPHALPPRYTVIQYTKFAVCTIERNGIETSELAASSWTKYVNRQTEINQHLNTNYVANMNFHSIFSMYMCCREGIHYNKYV